MYACLPAIVQACGDQKTLEGWFSPTMWLPGIKFTLPDLTTMCLYLLNHLASSRSIY